MPRVAIVSAVRTPIGRFPRFPRRRSREGSGNRRVQRRARARRRRRRRRGRDDLRPREAGRQRTEPRTSGEHRRGRSAGGLGLDGEPGVRQRTEGGGSGRHGDRARRGAHRPGRGHGKHDPRAALPGPGAHRLPHGRGARRRRYVPGRIPLPARGPAHGTHRRDGSPSSEESRGTARTTTPWRASAARVPPGKAGRFDDRGDPGERSGPARGDDNRSRATSTCAREPTAHSSRSCRPSSRRTARWHAGNSSGITDGAAALVIAGEDEVQRRGLKTAGLARGIGAGGGRSEDHGNRPGPRDEEALRADRLEDGRRGSHRAERGVRRAGPGRGRRPGAGPREGRT